MNILILTAVFATGDPFVIQQPDPRARRAERERVVGQVGEVARPLVEAHGEAAVAALDACSVGTARMLAEFHKEGKLDKLPKPEELLWCIAKPGNGTTVARFAVLHADELLDVDAFDAYLLEPVEYALALKRLQQGAAMVRARRLAAEEVSPWQDWRNIALAGVGLGVVLLLIRAWKNRTKTP